MAERRLSKRRGPLFNPHMRPLSPQRAHTPAARLKLFVFIALAIAALALARTGAPARADSSSADSSPVPLLSFDYQVNFGSDVDIAMTADVSAPVKEVRAIYEAVGPRQVSSYDYPSFTQGDTLSAEFKINTGREVYYPPGTQFEVYFELTMADDSVIDTESRTFLYLDPSKDWRTLSRIGIPLDIIYYGFSDSSANAIADRVASSWSGIAQALGIDPDTVDRRRAVVYPNVQDASAGFPPTSEAASDGTYFGGFALDSYNVFVIGGPWPDTAVHELTHLLVGQVVGSPLAQGVPSWLNEGLAQYFEVGSASYYTSQLSSAAKADRLLTLRTRNTVPSTASEISLFYVEVGSFVGELIEREGPEKMAEALSLIDGGSTAADAMEAAYGRPLWQLESEWRQRLGASPLTDPAATGSTPVATASEQTPQATATATPVGDTGVVLEPGKSDGGGGGFNMTGPIIGAIAAAVVFAVWSFFVNRRRFRRRR